MHECTQQPYLESVDRKVDALRKEVQEALKFKWMVTGVVSAITSLCGAIIILMSR